jgi:dinuclear metal center YbgI/SA1388 family protein
MKLATVIEHLQTLAPEHLAEGWDRVGLQVGDPEQDIEGGMLCIDLTEAVVAEAVDQNCQLVVAYHPPIFQPLTGLTADGPWTQRRILQAVRENLAIYSPHTALDAVSGGACDWLAGCIAPGNTLPITAIQPKRDDYKIVVFVPLVDEAKVRQAMADAGAGGIGNYRECSFSTDGVGGFTPQPGANPSIGEVGQREEVAERRLEMLCPGSQLVEVLHRLRQAHPYEEPAFDLFRQEPEPLRPTDAEGAGRLLKLDQPISSEQLRQKLSQALNVPIKIGDPTDQPIRTIAVCPGSGGKLFEPLADREDIDAFVTGEMQHHQALDLTQRGKVVALAGHTHTERPYLPTYRERMRKTELSQLDWHISEADTAPLRI